MGKNEIAIKIGGEAGFGIKAAGLILGKAIFKSGACVFGYSEYPSLIRGGHNTYQMNVAAGAVASATMGVDILVALDKKTVDLDKDYVTDGGILIYDGDLAGINLKHAEAIDVPLVELSEKAGGIIARNMAALGAAMYLIGLGLNKILDEVAVAFRDKGQETMAMNKTAVELGYNYLKNKKIKPRFNINEWNLENKKSERDEIMTANEAAATGMIWAGCKFYAAYPMTPATSIMHVLAEKQRAANLVVHQTEDEISAIGAAIGAATAGARAATGTSGGGFSLMTEYLGLAAITETPLVVIEAQRTGPATGLPTWTEQSDLKFIINASHGEFPRIVIAPGDASEAMEMIQRAFGLAEVWQLPVIFILDKYLSESDFTVSDRERKKQEIKRVGFVSDKELASLRNYKRYKITNSGASERSVPGQKHGLAVFNSDDHDECGFSSDESVNRKKMMDKRFAKVKLIASELPEPIMYGPKEAELTIIGWGSVKGVVLDAMQEIKKSRNQEIKKSRNQEIKKSSSPISEAGYLRKEQTGQPKAENQENRDNKEVSFLHLIYIWPFPKKRVQAILNKAKNILLIENNKTGQLGELVRQETGVEIKNKFLKYDGRPFFREEIVGKINELMGQ